MLKWKNFQFFYLTDRSPFIIDFHRTLPPNLKYFYPFHNTTTKSSLEISKFTILSLTNRSNIIQLFIKSPYKIAADKTVKPYSNLEYPAINCNPLVSCETQKR